MRLGGGGFNRGGGGGFDPSSLIGPAVLILLLGSGAFWTIIQFINGVFLLVLLVPLVAVPLVNWYLSSNIIDGACPDCGAPQQVIKSAGRHQCANCGTIMSTTRSESGIFLREGLRNDDGSVLDVKGVIDID
jgi:ribosomal protein S27E